MRSPFRRRLGLDSFDVPPPVPASGPVSIHLEEQPEARLRVWKIGDGQDLNLPWAWIVRRAGQPVEAGVAYTQPQALAVGLDALDTALGRRP